MSLTRRGRFHIFMSCLWSRKPRIRPRDPSRWPRSTLYPQKVGTNFTNKWRSLGRYSSLADWSHGVCVYVLFVSDRNSFWIKRLEIWSVHAIYWMNLVLWNKCIAVRCSWMKSIIIWKTMNKLLTLWIEGLETKRVSEFVTWSGSSSYPENLSKVGSGQFLMDKISENFLILVLLETQPMQTTYTGFPTEKII
jgi:hypothetical protein